MYPWRIVWEIPRKLCAFIIERCLEKLLVVSRNLRETLQWNFWRICLRNRWGIMKFRRTCNSWSNNLNRVWATLTKNTSSDILSELKPLSGLKGDWTAPSITLYSILIWKPFNLNSTRTSSPSVVTHRPENGGCVCSNLQSQSTGDKWLFEDFFLWVIIPLFASNKKSTEYEVPFSFDLKSSPINCFTSSFNFSCFPTTFTVFGLRKFRLWGDPIIHPVHVQEIYP